MAGALNYKATAMRNFKRQHDRIFSWLRRMGEWLQDLCITTRCHLEMTFVEFSDGKSRKANSTSVTLSVLAKTMWGASWKSAIAQRFF